MMIKMNKQKREPIVIDINIPTHIAIRMKRKKNLPGRDSNSHVIPSTLPLSVAAQLTELRKKLELTN